MTATTTKQRTRGKRADKSETKATKPKQKRTSSSASGGVASGFSLLLALVVLLCVFGSMMVLSSSSVEALRLYDSSWVFFKRQVVWMFLGTVALWLGMRTDYKLWRSLSVLLLGGSAFLLLVVLLPQVGIEVSGSRRWLGAGPMRMQPSEIAKFAMLVFASDVLARRVDVMHDWRVSIRPVVIVFLAFAFLIMLEPDMGTTMIVGSLTVSVLFVAGTRIKHMAVMLGSVAAAAAALAIAEPYRRARLLSFMDPFSDSGGGGYQVVQSLVGIGSGGLTGVGLGAGRAKWGFLPNAHTDFIFAIIGEELGLIGGVAVVLLFIGFAVLGVRAATRAPDRFGLLMASGITAWVVFQAFLNIGAVIGILPVTGVPLPFLSQGGSSLIVLMGATGILLNIARQGDLLPANAPSQDESGKHGKNS